MTSESGTCSSSTQSILDVEEEKEIDAALGLTTGTQSSSIKNVAKFKKEDIRRLMAQNSPRLTYVDKTKIQAKCQYWNKFQIIQIDQISVEFVKCKLCHLVYVWNNKIGTSNLKNHSCTRSDVADGPNKGTLKGVVADTTQTKITFSSKPITSKAIDDLNESIVIGLAQDLKPLRTVEGRGFRHIAQKLINFGAIHGNRDVSTVLQHRTTLKTKHLTNIVSRMEDDLKTTLKTTSSYPRYSFTMDMWSDRCQQRQFLSLTIHFINEKWELESHMLGVEEFEESLKSTDNIRTHVRRIISKYLGEEQCQTVMDDSTAVTDGGSNMINIFTTRYPCLCHRINLIVQWTLNQKPLPTPEKIKEQQNKGNPIPEKKLFNLQSSCPKTKDVLGALKKLVEYFKKSGINKNLPHTLKQEIETRWNSQLTMLESYSRSSEDVKKILFEKKKLEKASKIDDDVVKDLINFLGPFKECSETLGGDKYPTIHLVALWHYKLLQHIKEKEDDSQEIKLLKGQAGSCLKEYFNMEPIYYAACMLDPQKLKFVDEEKREQAVELLKLLMTAEGETSEQSTSTKLNSQNPQPPPPKKTKFSDLQDSDDEEVELNEMDMYLAHKFKHSENQDEKFNILHYWRDAFQFPTIRKVAKWLLAMPASQASDERVFSATGLTLSARRTELSGTTLSQLTFVHKNY